MFSPCADRRGGAPLIAPGTRRGRHQLTKCEKPMKLYVIEREIPGAADLSQEELAAIAGKSNTVVESLGVPYRWITSYVAGDKIYCVHEAQEADTIREHARR